MCESGGDYLHWDLKEDKPKANSSVNKSKVAVVHCTPVIRALLYEINYMLARDSLPALKT